MTVFKKDLACYLNYRTGFVPFFLCQSSSKCNNINYGFGISLSLNRGHICFSVPYNIWKNLKQCTTLYKRLYVHG